MKCSRDLLPEGRGVLNQRWVVFIFPCRFLERGLSSNRIEEDDSNSEDIGLARLMWELEVNFRTHIVYSANECF